MNIIEITQVVLIILKALDLINWSWALVFIPTYISIGIAILVISILVLHDMYSN